MGKKVHLIAEEKHIFDKPKTLCGVMLKNSQYSSLEFETNQTMFLDNWSKMDRCKKCEDALLKREWVCTDPNTYQYGRQLTDLLFEFKEKGKDAILVDLNDFDFKETEHIINAYGYTQMTGENKVPRLNNIVEMYKDKSNWIIAECIFESK